MDTLTNAFEGAVPESPRSANRCPQPKTRGSRNLLFRAVCVFKEPSKGQNACSISVLPALIQVRVRRACTVAQRKDTCRVPGSEWMAGMTQSTGMGKGVGGCFSRKPCMEHGRTQCDGSPVLHLLWREAGCLSCLQF